MEYVELYVAYILKVFVGFLILGTPGNGQSSSSSGFQGSGFLDGWPKMLLDGLGHAEEVIYMYVQRGPGIPGIDPGLGKQTHSRSSESTHENHTFSPDVHTVPHSCSR